MANNAVKMKFVARMMLLHIAIGKEASRRLGCPDELMQTHYMKPRTLWQVANCFVKCAIGITYAPTVTP